MSSIVKRRWEGDPNAYRKEARTSFVYEAFIPDLIGAFEPLLPASVAAEIGEAERAIIALQPGASASGLESLSRQLLRAESIASSRIEGLQISHRRLAEAALDVSNADERARLVMGNLAAMDRAIRSASESREWAIDDILAMHRCLFENTQEKATAGRLRERQNWLGGTGESPRFAEFIPPPSEEVPGLLADLCAFANRSNLPPLVQAAIAHAQFETIHPFPDGNGRVGRALIHSILRRRGLVNTVVPPVSLILATNAKRYVEGLIDFREERLDAWCSFFARATLSAAAYSARLAEELSALREAWRERVGRPRRHSAAEKLISLLPAQPVVDVARAAELLHTSEQAARLAILALEAADVLKPVVLGKKRNRAWYAPEVVALIDTLEWELAAPTREGEPRRASPRPR